MKITVEFDSLREFHEFIERQATKRATGKTPIRGSGLTGRTLSSLIDHGIEFLEDALILSDTALLHFPTFGRRSLNELRAIEKPNA